MFDNLYVALLHYPVSNRNGETVTAAITNLDIHDISRSSRAYGVREYGIVTPIIYQHQLIDRVIRHWKHGYGGEHNPVRKEALQLVEVYETLEQFKEHIFKQHNIKPVVIGTSAKLRENSRSFKDVKEMIISRNSPIILAFGTGWGLTLEGFQAIDFVLRPIRSFATDYNHLSVRAAVAIVLDRLLGAQESDCGAA
ncbi:MAG: hypothetical protein A3F16_08160 [Deltaproteobacteria bacterium RIFCSPHIGHO2_12_FULL_43_9]|nr:MAG: hypothetical protein A3F16_08160 [Deltaproteobacteria bacterium RIFCSPHIGHO2_12_FULL_43_9]